MYGQGALGHAFVKAGLLGVSVALRAFPSRAGAGPPAFSSVVAEAASVVAFAVASACSAIRRAVSPAVPRIWQA